MTHPRAPRAFAASLPALLAAAALFAAPPAQAHKASDAYVTLKVDGAIVDARIDIALRDLDRDLALDANMDDQLSWKEVRTRWGDIATLARNDIHLSADGARCDPEPASAPVTDANTPALTEHSDGTYAVLRTHWTCAAPVQKLSVKYDLFARTDPTHRGIARVSRLDAAGTSAGDDAAAPMLAVLSPGNGWHRFALPPLTVAQLAAAASAPTSADAPSAVRADMAATAAVAARVPGTSVAGPAASASASADADVDTASDASAESSVSSFGGFVAAGVHHILIGYDHILFLLSLLLPSVWIRSLVVDPRTGVGRTRWVPSQNLRLALTNVLKVVTAFTVAHSITLALAVFNIVNPPTRWTSRSSRRASCWRR